MESFHLLLSKISIVFMKEISKRTSKQLCEFKRFLKIFYFGFFTLIIINPTLAILSILFVLITETIIFK